MNTIKAVRLSDTGTRMVAVNDGVFEIEKTTVGKFKLLWFYPYCTEPIIRYVSTLKDAYHMIKSGNLC